MVASLSESKTHPAARPSPAQYLLRADRRWPSQENGAQCRFDTDVELARKVRESVYSHRVDTCSGDEHHHCTECLDQRPSILQVTAGPERDHSDGGHHPIQSAKMTLRINVGSNQPLGPRRRPESVYQPGDD